MTEERKAPGNGGITEEETRVLARVHGVQLGLLHEVDRICREHGIAYMAVHGTLLGAVRHRGFIPWDDDADIAMPRPEYDRFLEIARRELREPYFLQTPDREPGCFFGGYTKLRDSRTAALEERNRGRKFNQGIWIDIFPLDRCPSDPRARERLERRIARRQRVLIYKCWRSGGGMVTGLPRRRRRLYKLAAKVVPYGLLLRRVDRLCRSSRGKDTLSILACYYRGTRGNVNVYRAEECRELIRLPFEDMMIPVSAHWHEWLVRRYGEDYMECPPEEKRRIPRGIRFDTETSWRELI